MSVGKTRALFVVAMAAGAALIAYSSVSYVTEGPLHPFVLDREPLPHRTLWLLALYTHIVAATFSLPACLVLSSRLTFQAAPRVHRWMGRLTGAVVLFALVPSGTFLSTTAEGGLPSALGFVLSGCIVAIAMVQAVRAARRRDFAAHKRAIAHVTAQMSVAVTSRALLYLFHWTPLDEVVAYLLALWGPVVGSALFVERRMLEKSLSALGGLHETLRIPALVRKSLRNVGPR